MVRYFLIDNFSNKVKSKKDVFSLLIFNDCNSLGILITFQVIENHVEQPILGCSRIPVPPREYPSLLASSFVVFLQGEMAWKGRVSHLCLTRKRTKEKRKILKFE